MEGEEYWEKDYVGKGCEGGKGGGGKEWRGKGQTVRGRNQ